MCPVCKKPCNIFTKEHDEEIKKALWVKFFNSPNLPSPYNAVKGVLE